MLVSSFQGNVVILSLFYFSFSVLFYVTLLNFFLYYLMLLLQFVIVPFVVYLNSLVVEMCYTNKLAL